MTKSVAATGQRAEVSAQSSIFSGRDFVPTNLHDGSDWTTCFYAHRFKHADAPLERPVDAGLL